MRDNSDGHAGSEIRNPRIIQNDYLMLSRLSSILTGFIGRNFDQEKEIVLDLGCGKKPYQPFFQEKDCTYIGVDIQRSGLADIICVGEYLPFTDNVFSAILCSQVLEHVSEPTSLIKECQRVLKKNSFFFLSTHGTWPIHGAPHDYWRWTEYGLRKLFKDFKEVEIKSCGNSIVSILQLLEIYVPHSFSGRFITFPLNALGNFVDKLHKLNSLIPTISTNYVVKARKD